MLSLWKLRVGTEGYYSAQVASGLDDYYTGAGEAPGRWVGGSAATLGLGGAVDGADLRAVMAGLAPGTALTPNGTQLTARKRRVPGFDLTFAVPKSVSVLYALGDPLVQEAVLDAGRAAVAQALAWLERDACFVRRGTNNSNARVADMTQWGTRRLATSGFVAAQFPHRTSRSGDPHLHWHVLVANLARGVDGRWSALDGQALYAAKRAGGVLFQAALREELTRRLGVEWGPLHHDMADVAGVPRRVLREFSTRREQIQEWLDEHGRSGPAAAADAMAATRTSKNPISAEGLHPGWIDRARALGWGPEQVDVLLGNVPGPDPDGSRTAPSSPSTQERTTPLIPDAAFPGWAEQLLRSRLTAHDASFTRQELLQAVAGSLGAGGDVPEIERLAHRVLADPAVVPLARRPALTTGLGERDPKLAAQQWTTRQLLETEQALLAAISGGLGAGRGVLADGSAEQAVTTVEAGAPGLTFGPDQRDAVARLLSQGNAIEVLVGRAGTGKTTALAALRAAYEAAGQEVLGLAPSARAAREMLNGAGIPSQTIARFLHTDPAATRPTMVAIVDEAAMVGTRDLAAVVGRVVGSGGKVVLVGDHHQLPEITAGGGFRAALHTLGDQACELTVNRRQWEPWERTALDELRHGAIATAWEAYRQHDRVILVDDPAALHERVIDDWWHQRDAGRDVLAVAGTRAEAGLLNRLARHRMEAAGLLTGPAVEGDGRRYQEGDRVVLLRNSRDQRSASGHRATVANGMLADVVRTHPELGELTVVLHPTGEQVTLTADYVSARHVDHGYAVTIHKAQGLTCDAVLVVGPAGLNREGAYVAMSRARRTAHLYATRALAEEAFERHEQGIPLPDESTDGPEGAVLARLHRSGAKTFASVTDPDALAVLRLVADHPPADLARLARAARAAEARCASTNPAEQRRAVDRATETRQHLAPGRRVRALDRDNIGVVTDLHDGACTATVHFLSESGATADRTLPWSHLAVIDHPDAVELSDAAAEALRRMVRTVRRAEAAWRADLAQAGFAPGDGARLTRAAELALAKATHQLQADPPDWLRWWLGHRPADQIGAHTWDDALATIASWRALHEVPDPVPGLGPEPDQDGAATEWRDHTLKLLAARSWLADREPASIPKLVPRPPTELAARRAALEAVLAQAPPDQSRIVEDLRSGRLTTDALHRELATAAEATVRRNTWILEHWPHIVELEQIDLLLDDDDLLAHWPTADPQEVIDALALLRRQAPRLSAPEPRTLAALAAAQQAADPTVRLGHRLDALERQLAELRSAAETAHDPGRQSLVDAAHGVASAERDQLLSALERARHDAAIQRVLTSYTDDHHAPATPEQRRRTTVIFTAMTDQPPWVVGLARQLRANGDLAAMGDALIELVADVAVYRDRWQVAGDMPLGVTPDDPAHAAVHEQLAARLSCPTPTISAPSQ